MPKYQLLGCHIALAGDPRAVVSRGTDLSDAVTYPEVMVLQQVHGYDAITDIHEVGWTEDRVASDERRRLVGLYTEQPVNDVFGGNATALPTKGDFPTLEDVLAARKAAEDAMARRREQKARKQNTRTADLKVEAAPVVDEVEEV